MKHTLTIIGSAMLIMSPMLSLITFMLYGGKDQTIDAICFVAFGVTMYALARFQTYTKNN